MPLVTTFHTTLRSQHGGRIPPGEPSTIHAVESWLAHGSDQVIAPSMFMSREVLTGFELPAERIHRVPNGIDPTWWSAGEWPETRPPMVLTWGRVQYEKGFQVLARAISTLRSRVPDVECIIAGRGSYLPELQSQVDIEGVSDIVRLVGFVSDVKLRDLVHRAGCVAIPSLYEPFGIVALETLAGGAPLIAARTGGLAELIAGTGAGLLFEPGNADELAACIERVLGDRQSRRRHAGPRHGAARCPLLVGGDRRGDDADLRRRHPRRDRRRPLPRLTPMPPRPECFRRRSVPAGNTRMTGNTRLGRPLACAAMRPVRRFEVRPTIPEALAALPGLATNLHWAWDREAVRLFERIWPGWTAGDAHPAHMVRTTSSERLAALAEDQAVVRDLAAAKGRLEAAITGPTWFAGRREPTRRRRSARSPTSPPSSASPRRCRSTPAASACCPATTSRRPPTSACRWSASACCTPRATSTRSSTPTAGSRSTRLNMDPESLGLTDTGVRVTVDLAGDEVAIRVWRADVGKVALYLLDTDVEGNSRRRHRRHRPALRRRLASPPAPGDRPRHRRRARAARPRDRPAGVPQQRGPCRVPQPRTDP